MKEELFEVKQANKHLRLYMANLEVKKRINRNLSKLKKVKNNEKSKNKKKKPV